MGSLSVETSPAAHARFATAFPSPSSFSPPAGHDGSDGDQALRDKVGEFVGNVFYGTLFRQMRESRIQGKYFHGGRGEEIFRAQFDMELAARMGRSPGDPIANGVFDWLVRNSDRGASTGRGSSDPLQRTNTRRA